MLPGRLSLSAVRDAAARCKACHLYARATQTVFGEGPRRADVMMVGEQPGDVEDVEGHPFVGPAGRLLDRALAEAGLDRQLVYVTNVVKHFKWEPRGKRRIHAKPGAAEVAACRPWLETEIALVKPRMLVCLGAVAAQALLGRGFKVSAERGRLVESTLAPLVMATVHPSSILRSRDESSRRRDGGVRRRLADCCRGNRPGAAPPGWEPLSMETFRPTLLMSMPQLQDPNFARTVVLLCDYASEGAFGLVLNRPTEMPATSMVKLDPPIVGGNELPLCIGGPVDPERGWILIERRRRMSSSASSRTACICRRRRRSCAACCRRRRRLRARGCWPVTPVGGRVSSTWSWRTRRG